MSVMESRKQDQVLVGIISTLIIVNGFLYFLYHDQTFVHIDAIAHVNKARGLFDNFSPGLKQLGTVWLPLPHILSAPFAAIDPLWRNGAAGSLIRRRRAQGRARKRALLRGDGCGAPGGGDDPLRRRAGRGCGGGHQAHPAGARNLDHG